jgi:purine-binding chemotaxis protein CheW
MKALSFLVSGELFAVDVKCVQKVVRKMMVTRVPAAPVAVIGIANLNGKVITIFSLDVLLGCKEECGGEPVTNTVSAVIFKSFSGGEDQMGLSIDKPGTLINIDDDTVCPPSLAIGAEDSHCISGVGEVGNKLYRIISIDSIVNKYRGDGGIGNAEKN